MSFISRFNPTNGVKDFWAEFRRPQPYRIPIMVVSLLIPIGLIALVVPETVIGPPPPPEITYIRTFRPDRTLQEIIDSNIASQKRNEAKAALELERVERRKELYRALGRATGLDVDQMEKDIAAERAREEQAEAAKNAVVVGVTVAPAQKGAPQKDARRKDTLRGQPSPEAVSVQANQKGAQGSDSDAAALSDANSAPATERTTPRQADLAR